MVFRRGQKVELYRKSEDESWEAYMDEFVGLHGIVTDPDTAINDPDALVEISLDRQRDAPPAPGLPATAGLIFATTGYSIPMMYPLRRWTPVVQSRHHS